MRLPAKTRLGPYELLAPLGTGGMGEVYKARDTRLERIVAIKVLPQEFATDPDRRERFEREARAIAGLSHPHICHLHDVGEAAGADVGSGGGLIRFLVMEHLEGPTLAERLLRGALPLAESLATAIEIADALDHAHQRGLIHRDLKPSNVMLTAAGAKLLDFGLSKLQAHPGLAGLSTVASGAPLTEKGTVLGTFPYMSPEQLQGHEADARTDIFALGAMVYEMASGQRAFEGATAAALIGAIIHTQPQPLTSVQPLTPPALERLVARCLAKDPDDRWQTARDVFLELRWIAEPSPRSFARANRALGQRSMAVTAAVLTVVAVVAGAIANYLPRERVADAPITLTFSAPEELTLTDAAIAGPVTISPDGQRFAFVATGPDGKQLLWVRAVESLSAQPLPGTDGALFPFWSPDSRVIGFFAQRRLKTIRTGGGPTQTLCEAIQPRGGTMRADGVVVFSADAGRQLYRISAGGGEPVPIPADGFNDERYWPSFLPDGRHFVYFGRPQRRGVYLAETDSSAARLLLSNRIAVAYSPSGHLLTLAGSARGEFAGTLTASRFDTTGLAVSGDSIPIAENVPYHSGIARGAVSVSDNGTIVYGNIKRQTKALVWFDRSGKELNRLESAVRYGRPWLSPDATTVVVQGVEQETQQADLWLIDTARNIPARFTSDAAFEDSPVWSPDGTRIVFSSPRDNRAPNLYEKPLTGPGHERALIEPGSNHRPTDWSRDGRFVVYGGLHPRRQWDLWLLPATGAVSDRTPIPYLQTEFNEHLGRVAPDGRWLSYVSDESGTNEVYVQTFPEPGAKRRISAAGGSEPIWRQDGRELYYIAPDGTLIAVGVKAGQSFEMLRSVPLFRTKVSDEWLYDTNYAVTPDGQRFLINVVTSESTAAPAVVVLNWPALLARQ